MAYPLQATVITGLDTLYNVATEVPSHPKARELARKVKNVQALCEEINGAYDLSTAATSDFYEGYDPT